MYVYDNFFLQQEDESSIIPEKSHQLSESPLPSGSIPCLFLPCVSTGSSNFSRWSHSQGDSKGSKEC